MAKDKSWIDNNHYRTTSDDGKTSYLYQAGFWSDTCVEIAEHHSDGTTTAHEVGGVLDSLFNKGKGNRK